MDCKNTGKTNLPVKVNQVIHTAVAEKGTTIYGKVHADKARGEHKLLAEWLKDCVGITAISGRETLVESQVFLKVEVVV